MPGEIEKEPGKKRKLPPNTLPNKKRKKKKKNANEDDPVWIQQQIDKILELFRWHCKKSMDSQDSVRSIQKQTKKQKQKYQIQHNARNKLVAKQKNLERQLRETQSNVDSLRQQNEEMGVKHKKKLDKLLKEKARLLKKTGKDPKIVKRKLPENLQGCGLVLEFLKKHMRSRTPPADIFIPPIPKTVRSYFKVIKRPMWLNKIESNLYLGKYKNVKQFKEDVNLVWRNAKKFNPIFNQVHVWATEYEGIFVREMDKRYDSLGLPIMKKKGGPAKVPPKREAVPSVVKKQTIRKKLSEEKISRIENNFHLLPQAKQEEVLVMIQPYTDTSEEDEIELDLDNLPYEAQLKLYQFLDAHFKFDQKSEGLPDVCESPERDETSKKSAGPAPPLEAHRPSKVAPVSNPFQSKVSNPFASSVPTTQVKRKLESKPDSNKWNVNTVGSKVDQAKQSYFKTLQPKQVPSQPPPLQPAPAVKRVPKKKIMNNNKLPPLPSLVPVKPKPKMQAPPPVAPPPIPQAPTPSITPNVNLNEQRDLMNELEDLL